MISPKSVERAATTRRGAVARDFVLFERKLVVVRYFLARGDRALRVNHDVSILLVRRDDLRIAVWLVECGEAIRFSESFGPN